MDSQDAKREHAHQANLLPRIKLKLADLGNGQRHDHKVCHHVQCASRHIHIVSVPTDALYRRIPIVCQGSAQEECFQNHTHRPGYDNANDNKGRNTEASRCSKYAQVKGDDGHLHTAQSDAVQGFKWEDELESLDSI